MTTLEKTDYFRPCGETLLSDDWGRLTRYSYSLRLRDGAWQDQTREVYDRGHGAACLLHNPATDTVLLTRQFRLPAFTVGHSGYLVEAPAGLLEGADPASRMRLELEEETGHAISVLTPLYDIFMSPGSVSERLSFFIGTYSEKDRVSAGGGAPEEGEDIEVLHIPLDTAWQMIRDGRIDDAKTIMLIQHYMLMRAGVA